MLKYFLTKGHVFVSRGLFISFFRALCFLFTLRFSGDEMLDYASILSIVSMFVLLNGGLLQNYLLSVGSSVSANDVQIAWNFKLKMNFVSLFAALLALILLEQTQLLAFAFLIALINLSPPVLSFAPILGHDRWYLFSDGIQVLLYFLLVVALYLSSNFLPELVIFSYLTSLLIRSIIEIFYYYFRVRKMVNQELPRERPSAYVNKMLSISVIDWFEQRGFLIFLSAILSQELMIILSYGERLRTGFSIISKMIRPFFLYFFNTKYESTVQFLDVVLVLVGSFAFMTIYSLVLFLSEDADLLAIRLLLFFPFIFIPSNVVFFTKLTRYGQLNQLVKVRAFSLLLAYISLTISLIVDSEMLEIFSIASVPLFVYLVDRVLNVRRLG